MNQSQRNSNRENAKKLNSQVRLLKLASHTCENCGEPGGHWVSTRGMSLQAILTGQDDQEGFWTCDQYYDSVTGVRKKA
jgi:hypothetical protein